MPEESQRHEALTAVYGKREFDGEENNGHSLNTCPGCGLVVPTGIEPRLVGSLVQMRSCPACSTNQPVALFSSVLKCGKDGCGTKLGQYVLQWEPYVAKNGEQNGEMNAAMIYVNAYRQLGAWVPPEDDPLIKNIREYFKKKCHRWIRDEDAHFLMNRIMTALKKQNRDRRRKARIMVDVTVADYLQERYGGEKKYRKRFAAQGAQN